MAPSAVWIYFKKAINGSNVQCNQCEKQLKYNNSTTSLIKHLTKAYKIDLTAANHNRTRTMSEKDSADEIIPVSQPKQPRLSEVSNQLVPSSTSSTLSLNSESERSIFQGPIDRCIRNATSFSEGGHRNNEATTALMYMIAVDNLPLCTPEKKGFRMLVKKLQPLYQPPCEPTITKRMESKYEELKIKVKRELKEADSICLTTDIWTHQHTMCSYLGLTAHYLKGYKMTSYELGAYHLTERKTIPYLMERLNKICEEWGIRKSKISAVLSDGCSNIKGAIKQLFGEAKHVSCFGHSLNNIGQSLIEVNVTRPASESDLSEMVKSLEDESDTENDSNIDQKSQLRNLLVKVKKIVKFFRCSENASRELMSLQEESGAKPPLKLIQEVRTRWNSCYEMLDRFIKIADYVNRALLKVQRDKSAKSKPPDVLSGDDLDTLIEIEDVLYPLWFATHEASTDKHVTLSKCIPLVKGLQEKTNQLNPITTVGQDLKKRLIAEIKQKFSNIESVKVYHIATLLDPRYKKVGFQSILDCSRAIASVGSLVREEVKVSQNLAVKCNSQLTIEDQQTCDMNKNFWDFLDQAVESSNQYYDNDEAGGVPIELRQFINRLLVNRGSTPDPLLVWKNIENEYPHVSTIARRYLSIVATSTSCERLFSHTGLIANKIRRRLTPDHLNMLLFMKSVPESEWFS